MKIFLHDFLRLYENIQNWSIVGISSSTNPWTKLKFVKLQRLAVQDMSVDETSIQNFFELNSSIKYVTIALRRIILAFLMDRKKNCKQFAAHRNSEYSN